MHFSMILALATAVSAVATQYEAAIIGSSFDLSPRQGRQCSTVPAGPNLCERSCGPGYAPCIEYNNCYLPTAGQTCCANGNYCPAGTYCADTKCCLDGETLEECGANRRVSVIPPPDQDAPTSTTSGGGEATPTTPTTSGPGSSTPSSPSAPYPTPSGEPTSTRTGSSGLPQPTQSAPIYTGGADVNAHRGVGSFALGGFGLLAMWL